MKKISRLAILLMGLLITGSTTIAQTFSFGMFTDVHYAAIPDNGTRKYRQSLDKVKQCIDTMNQKKVGFLIELGDFKDMPVPTDNQKALGFLRVIETEFSRFKGDRYHVLGNHDEDCISKEQFYSIAQNSRISKNDTWYSFQKGGYQFIVLDACFDSTGRAYDKGNFEWFDSNVPAHELTWLNKVLSDTKLPVVVFVHQLLNGETKVSVKNAAAVRAILEQSKKVKCVFQGHDHKGGYEQINGIHYYTVNGLIEGNFPESNSYAIVTLSTGKIIIHGFGQAVSKELIMN
ncbi:MAG: metallophosphoesterase [Prolixibacteraceae bacterium]